MAPEPFPPLEQEAKAARACEAGPRVARPEVEEALMARRRPTLPLDKAARVRKAGPGTARPEVEEAR